MNPSDRETKALDPGAEPTTIESVVRSLRRLLDGNEQEQRETFEYLKRALDESSVFPQALSVSKTVLLDAGPLGMISNPNAVGVNRECYEWMEALVVNGFEVRFPEITDYEVRRKLLRANKSQGIDRLDLMKNTIGYLPLNTTIMLHAAELWAQARRTGMPTADPKALDCDVILAAQASSRTRSPGVQKERGVRQQELCARVPDTEAA
jgi:predicted nucleic acid-binding protein